MQGYIDILRQWEIDIANPAIYESLPTLFPEYSFRRLNPGTERDHWASRYKIDLTLPRTRSASKTVVYRNDFSFREQGRFNENVRVMDMFIEKYKCKDVYEAYRYVSEILGLSMPMPDSPQILDSLKLNSRKKTLLSELQGYFSSLLFTSKDAKAARARGYLKNTRGFSKDSIEKFGFGFVPSWDVVERRYVTNGNYTKEELDSVCQVRGEDGKTFVGKTNVLSIPYICAGVQKGFLFRRVDSIGFPKYIANTDLDRKSVFFNMPVKADQIVVVEGELDALKATAAGIKNVVAIGGSDITGERRRQVVDAFGRGVKKITLCLDLDSDSSCEGKVKRQEFHSHVMKSVHTIKDINPDFEEIFIVEFPYACDPDEFICKNGGDAFASLIDQALPYWKYLYKHFEGTL